MLTDAEREVIFEKHIAAAKLEDPDGAFLSCHICGKPVDYDAAKYVGHGSCDPETGEFDGGPAHADCKSNYDMMMVAILYPKPIVMFDGINHSVDVNIGDK